MSFTADLRSRTNETWTKATTHRFVDELWKGTVEKSVLSTYLSQDALFVDTFIALMGAAVSHSDSPDARVKLARQLGLVATDEDGFFTRALEHLQCKPATPLPPTKAFIDLMNEARGDYASALTVLLVAEWLYLDWATQEERQTPEDWICTGWIDLHRGEWFEVWVELLKSETDRVAAASDEATRRRMGELFERAVELELEFFDAAYQ